MDLKRKLTVLADAAKHDASCASSGGRRSAPAGGVGHVDGTAICHSYTPDGRCVSLLKILLTNYCIYDCRYCESRISSNVERASFEIAEVVSLTLDLYRRNYIEGLFLSSGVRKSADHTMQDLCRVARALREEHAFGGYIHLKAPPGVSKELLEEAGRFADRLSVNTELPTPADLALLAPEKKLEDIEGVMARVRDARAEHEGVAPAGQTTQIIVGATPASDATILRTATRLYATYGLRRVYFAGFSPIVHHDRLLPAKPPPLVREHRLYESDWLVRRYGFSVEEIFEAGEHLDLAIDPKLAWAIRHRELFPVDINRAPREMLLRVPGIGTKTVALLIRARRRRAIRLDDLARMRVSLKRAGPFVVTADANPAARSLDDLRLGERVKRPQQLELFAAAANAKTGEL